MSLLDLDIAELARQVQKVKFRVGGAGGPSIEVSAGAPTGARVKGSLVIDITNAELYICTVATGTYVKVGTQS